MSKSKEQIANEVKALNVKRGTEKAKITRAQTFLLAVNETVSVIAIKNRLTIVEDAYTEILVLQALANELDPECYGETDPKVAEMETFYLEVKEKAQQLLADVEQPRNRRDDMQDVQSKPRLPDVPLPKFDGSYLGWPEFKNLFEPLVGKNSALRTSPALKIHYLKEAIKGGSAKGLISDDIVKANNYEAAWKLLEDRYGNERIQIESHIEAIIFAKKMSKECSKELKELTDLFSQHVSSLKSLDQATEGLAENIIVYLLSSKLDNETRKYWEDHVKKNEMPSYEDMISKLMERARTLESIEAAVSSKSVGANQKGEFSRKTSTKSFISAENAQCSLCNGSPHNLYNCSVFKKLKPQEMKQKLKEMRLCFICFRSGHPAQTCTAPFKCDKCQIPHNKILHVDKKSNNNDNDDSQNKGESEKSKNPEKTIGCWAKTEKNANEEVLLSTAMVLVEDTDGNLKLARALLDNGSQSNFMTEKFAKKLRIQRNKTDVKVTGIAELTIAKTSVKTTVKSRDQKYGVDLECLVIPKITGKVPSTMLDRKQIDVSDDKLADPRFHIPADVDLLIGGRHFMKLLMEKKKMLSEKLMLQESVFGYVVGGIAQQLIGTEKLSFVLHSFAHEEKLEVLNNTLQKFWEIEKIPHPSLQTPEERYCESHFEKTYRRDEDGRFVVELPLKENFLALGESKHRAMKMLQSLERKLSTNEELKIEYSKFMNEFLELGHMEIVKGEDKIPEKSFYMPHHCVLKPTSTTTKVRVVFNASAKSSTDLSLNDVLMVGPKIQQDLRQILIRFRKHRYVIVADIEKMYRQVKVHPLYCDLQRIVCKMNDENNTYRLLRVTYGTGPGTFLATKSVWKIADIFKEKFPIASARIKTDFYVDDLLCGADSEEEVIKLRKEIDEILSAACFKLRKWSSNSPEILKEIPVSDRAKTNKIEINEEETLTTLGVTWNPQSDVFVFEVKPCTIEKPCSKRHVLSEIAKIYDPYGFVEPVIVTHKIFMQELWKLKLDWDENLPPNCESYWKRLRNELTALNQLKIDRFVKSTHGIQGECELVGFSDASEVAFGACVYIRTKLSDNQYATKLLTSKTRVAPIKTVTLPRLELCAALLLAELIEFVMSAIEENFKRVILFSDSEIVLCWLKKSPSQLTTFVGNRVSEIQRLTHTFNWRHIESKLNPADLISRGISATELVENTFWWNGPTFLSKNESDWPDNKFNNKIENLPDVKKGPKEITNLLSKIEQEELRSRIFKFSSYSKLKSVVAWMMRFKNNSLSKSQKVARETDKKLQVKEITEAENVIIRLLQHMSFAGELKDLKDEKCVNQTSKLKFLNPFIDGNSGLIRVGGRIQHSNLSFDVKQPIVLDSKNPVVYTIAEECHRKNGHAAQQTLLAILRQKFWIVGARNLLRKVCHDCIVCFRAKPRLVEQFMGNLPAGRLNEVFPFYECAVDYAGPIWIKIGGPRSTKKVKAYVVVFVCFVTKAIHLELASDATASCFIAALRRFISERGYPAHIHSDNGGNFVKANSDLIELKELFCNQQFQKDVTSFCVEKGIQWHFTPARSPHMNGLCESSVKIMKYHLVRMTANLLLTFEQQLTVLKEIQSIVNSRPITQISNDPNDPVALTPAHFILGREATAIPEPSYDNISFNRLTIWEKIQQVKQQFWKRFSTEYITALQQRLKWYGEKVEIKLGALALIKEENLKPQQWLLGKIVKLYPGSDNIVRVVDLKTQTTILKRSVHRICVLPDPKINED